ncbi:hypothetical protein BDB01DRAFT_909466 [Pilobolus umbonatus]|nr:hypothetical protein BDB01DRAFT_909466 [Pilobolus umbonatus]
MIRGDFHISFSPSSSFYRFHIYYLRNINTFTMTLSPKNTANKEYMDAKELAIARLKNRLQTRNITPPQQECNKETSNSKRNLDDDEEDNHPVKKQKVLPAEIATPTPPKAPVVRASTPIGSHGLGEALDLSDFSPIMVSPRVSPSYSSPPSSPPSSPRASLRRYRNIRPSNENMTAARNLYQRLLANDYEPLKLPCYSDKDEEYDL